MDAIWQFLPNFKLLMLAILVFVPLERLFALHRQQQLFRKLWKMDALYILLNSAIVGLGIHWLLFAALLLAPMAVPDEFEAWLGSQPFWLQFPLLLLAADLVFYGMHRMFHRVPWMWKFHAVHHSIEELDWLAAHRIHAFDMILTKGASLLPVFALGFSEGPIAAFFFIYSWQTLFIHANVRFEFGLLGRILATPRFHHWHHANHAEAIDRNFAAQLSFLDWLFGTLYMPEREMPKRYGTDTPVPLGFLEQFVFPVVKAKHPAPEGQNLDKERLSTSSPPAE